ncbi:MAG: hypothetical protein KJO69_00150 [Gammaproteobacteria bacterium]|nr:hypothetical protein [Gammaproteobacteria bacterium]
MTDKDKTQDETEPVLLTVHDLFPEALDYDSGEETTVSDQPSLFTEQL